MAIETGMSREILGNLGAGSRLLFALLAAAATACFAAGILSRARRWRQGRPARDDGGRSGRAYRLGRLIMRGGTASGPIEVRVAHGLVAGGFSLLFLGTAVLALEHHGALIMGQPPATPLFLSGAWFALYEFLLDTAGLALIAGGVILLWKRGTTEVLVIAVLVLLGLSGFVVESLRILIEPTAAPAFSYVGSAGAFLVRHWAAADAGPLHLLAWWLHAGLALVLIGILPFTRLRHAVAGILTVALRGRLPGTLPPVTIEDVEAGGRVGAASIGDLTRQQLITLDACVSCGRCDEVCPAAIAGLPLAPRTLVAGLRRHLDLSIPGDRSTVTERPLVGDAVQEEAIWSCTTCQACVEACGLAVDPLQLIVDVRRNLVGENRVKGATATALRRLARRGNPWGLEVPERTAWIDRLGLPLASTSRRYPLYYWPGCAAASDLRVHRVAQATVRLLQAAGVEFAVVGGAAVCCGEGARRLGDEFLFQQLAATNLELFDRCGVQRIVTHCPHCLNCFRNDYPQVGGRLEVVHHTELLDALVAEGRLAGVGPGPTRKRRPGEGVTYHDPCYLGRVHGHTAEPRRLVEAYGRRTDRELVELPRRGREASCCGAGGGRMWVEEPAGDVRCGDDRVDEVARTCEDRGLATVAVSCPFCLMALEDRLVERTPGVAVKDVAELVAEAAGIDLDAAASAPVQTEPEES